MPRRRCENSIRGELKERDANWIDSAQLQGILVEGPCECGLEFPGHIIHGVSS